MSEKSGTIHLARYGSFNPHPSRRKDESGRLGYRLVIREIVSIHILPEGRMKDVGNTLVLTGFIVSIHILPEGRMKVSTLTDAAGMTEFQSTSFPKEG